MKSIWSVMDQTFAWALMAIGVAHLATGLAIFKGVTEGWIWFMGTGAAAFGIGALNLARRWHGHQGWGLRALCLASNAILLAIVAAYAASFGDQLTWQVIVIPAVVAVSTVFALEAALSPR
jgi:hypothetical protein